MDLDRAKEIASLVDSSKMIEAIKLFREDVPVSLPNAKSYLEEFSRGGEEALFDKLCADFVQSTFDRLAIAKENRRQLDLYIEQLEVELAKEQK